MPARGKHDAHWLHHALEDARGNLGLVALGRAVHNPDLIASFAQILPHALEAGAAEEARHGDEGHDTAATAFGLAGNVLEHLACRPAPEVDVQIAKVLGMGSQVPGGQRLPVVQRRVLTAFARGTFYPPALALGLVFVRRIADHHGNGLLALHPVGGLALVADRGGEARKGAAVVFGIAQRVGDVHARGHLRQSACQGQHLGQHPQLRHGERAQLKFEGDQAPQCRLHGGWHRAWAFVFAHALGQMAQHTQQEGARARGRVGHGHAVGGQATRQRKARSAQRFVDQRDHRPDDFRRRVVRASLLAQVVVVDLREVFVEVQPGVGLALAQSRPVHRIQHPLQRAERRVQGAAGLLVVGQQLQRRADERGRVLQALGHLVQIGADRDATRPRHQQPEGDRLGVAIRELLVAGLGEEQSAPILGQRCQCFGLAFQRLDHLVAQQATEACGHLSELLRRPGRDGLPLKEEIEQGQQAGPRGQRCA